MKLLIVDDHPLFRAGLRTLFETLEEFQLIGEACDGKEAVNLFKELKPDIVIMDINMPGINGIETTKEILFVNKNAKILTLSIHSDKQYVHEMLNAGAVGYLLKDDAPDELLRAIGKVNKGDVYLSSGVTRSALSSSDDIRKEPGLNILKTKLHRPQLTSDYVNRTRIIKQLEDNIDKPLSIVSAPAGYGKSITVSQWLENTKTLFTWVSLDEEYNDLRIFISYLRAAVEKIIPGSLPQTGSMVSAAILPPLKHLSTSLLNELDSIEQEFILVLDDFHKIINKQVHHLINELVSFPPEKMHLSILSRTEPPVDIQNLLTHHRVTLIGREELSFSKSEVQDLYSNLLHLDLRSDHTDRILEKTEGWAVGLRLFSLLMDNPDKIENILEVEESDLNIFSDYLVSELLSKLSKDVTDWLLRSSILNRFCVELLDFVFPDELSDKNSSINGANFCQKLVELNLFVIPLDNENVWFRYHHLFQSQMQAMLNKELSIGQIAEYHLRASEWFENKGFLEEAMEHSVAVKNYERAGEIIKKHRLYLLQEANFERLERLQRCIPMDNIESDPELLLIEFNIHWNHDNFVRIGELEKKMNLVIDQLDEGSYVHGEFNFYAGFVSVFLKGDVKLALDYLEMAMQKVPESASGPRGMLEVIYMIFSQLGGMYEKVCRMFYELAQKELPLIRKYRVVEGFLVASFDQLNMHEIEANLPGAVSFARKSNNKEVIGVTLYLNGQYLLRKGLLPEAIRCFREVMDIRYYVHTRVVSDNLTSLILSYSMINLRGKAEEVIQVMESYTEGLGDYFKSFYWSAKMRYHLIHKERDAVISLLSGYMPGVLDLVLWMDIPEITYARALIFEGSAENLGKAEKQLAELESITGAIQNRLHLVDVLILQALLFNIKGKTEKAKEALLHSVEISAPEGMVLPYIEMGEELVDILIQIREPGETGQFIKKVIDEIENRKEIFKSEKKPPELQQQLLGREGELETISVREREILQLIAEGFRNREIADKFFISPLTVKKHISNTFQKLNVDSRIKAVKKAKELKII